MVLAKEKIDLRGFERRPGEVLLRQDILGHRLIDVTDVELVPAYDVELDDTGAGWVLARLDTRRPARMFALAGLLLPSASVFRLLLCNDREVLGPWINPRWLNLLAGLIVSVLLLLSGILMSTTLFPCINVMTVSEQIATAIVILGLLTGASLKIVQHRTGGAPATPARRRRSAEAKR